MAKVYDYVEGVPATTVSHVMPNGSIKQSKANQLERFIALQPEVQRKLISEGMAIFQRADFRMKAVQARHLMKLREALAAAILDGDPKKIEWAQRDLDEYYFNRTQVTWAQADIDFHIMLYRRDGKAFHVEVDNEGGRGGKHILKRSLTM